MAESLQPDIDYDAWSIERLVAGRTMLQADLYEARAVASDRRREWVTKLKAELASLNAALGRKRLVK